MILVKLRLKRKSVLIDLKNEDKGYEKAAKFYDVFDTKKNIDYFLKFARDCKRVLDIGAGTGRIAIPLAKKGLTICCIEPSAAMREEFQKKMNNYPELENKITIIPADAKSFSLNEKFEGAFLSGTFDHILTNKERKSVLTNIYQHLTKNGQITFDIFIGEMKSSPISLIDKIKKDNREYHRFIGREKLSDGTINVKLIYKVYENEELIETVIQHSIAKEVTREEVHQILHKTGFQIIQEFGSFTMNPYSPEDEILIVLAQKRGNERKKYPWKKGQA
ncbi:class I SAM-dependent methyltransferase [Candidatus Heimdallarchaeota archaeon]|nr:MAG: class I SAM-dependent methyltransferase [Candidatus Heimdallarchaeota archaeon]